MVKTVAELCQEQQVTLAQLAERAGLEDSRAAAIALGRWTPSPDERQKIAAVFNVSVKEIQWGHSTPVSHLYGHGPGGQTS
jgi:transcriptional regulator with XRE-family HTH domain